MKRVIILLFMSIITILLIIVLFFLFKVLPINKKYENEDFQIQTYKS